MNLSRGSRIGHYEIVEAIGAGGMGEVYRAHDPRLHRDVAIKVLPPQFTTDPERLARFAREARTLAALNHPHVAQVYGVEEGALVMELVDGDDLAARLTKTGPIPLEDAIPIALQIAEALEAAHDRGIIHRDLKPANVKVRPDGTVKVLDFGLAKALEPAAGAPGADPAASPTITSPFALSNLGVILGTAAYMAPEQARGRPIDKRADIWAFGCVLYEMLTRARAFPGDDVTETLAAIVRAEPDYAALPAETPASIRTLLRRCLAKDPRERLPDIGAARLDLKDALLPVAGATPMVPRRRASIVPWLLFAAASVAAIVLAAYALRARPEPDTRVFKSVVIPSAPMSAAPALRFQLSPDGRRLVYVASDSSGRGMLWMRPLDGLDAQAIRGTEDAQAPLWSPDGRWVAFTSQGKLKKVDLSTGAVMSLVDIAVTPPGSWSREDVILFTQPAKGISRVSAAAGGRTELVTEVQAGEQTHISPFFLPDGRHFLFTVSAAGALEPGVFVGSLDSRQRVRVLDHSTNASFANGHLIFLRDTTLMAQPFDLQSLKLTGTAVPLAEGLQVNPATGTGAFSVSANGVLAYQTGSSAGTQLMWIDRKGTRRETLGPPLSYRDVQMSRDNRFVSFTISGGAKPGDIWLLNLDRQQQRRFTFDEFSDAGLWSPDDRYLYYSSRRGGRDQFRNLYRKAASGGEPEELVFANDVDKVPLGFSPKGDALLFRTATGAASGPLFVLPLVGERKPREFNPAERAYSSAAISPNGKWLAYAAGETGRRDVYVTSFPDGNGKWQMSTGGGENPIWRDDGRELFFMSNDRLVAREVDTSGDRFDAGPDPVLFSVHVPASTLGTRSTYAAARDGQKFLVNTWDAGAAIVPITLVVNWPATVQR